MRMRNGVVVVLAVVVCLVWWTTPAPAQGGRVAASGDTWMRFRGPNGTGVSPSTGLPVEFGPASAVIWKTSLPPGHSSPVVTATRIFVTAHTADKENYTLSVIGLDRQTGKVMWQREVPRRQKGRLQNVNGPASPSPVTDGASVFVFFQDFGLLAFSADGAELWRLPMGPFSTFYGFGASPILVDDAIILPVDQDGGSYLVSVDKKTGKVRWKVDRPGVISGYSTPTVYEPASGPKQVVIPESFQLSAYSVADGARVWWVLGLPCEMKSVASYDREYLYVNGWGFPQNQPGQHVATVPFEDGLKRYDRDGDGFVGRTEVSGAEPDGQGARAVVRIRRVRPRSRRKARCEGVGRLPADDGVGERIAGHQARRPR